MTIREIGCCGAYCKTCLIYKTGGNCQGCKLGYDSGERDIAKARCRMKLCCFRDKKLETCADCPDYSTCDITHGFYARNGYKYRKYQESIEFIRQNGYREFMQAADTWKGPYGRLPG
jgi:hypothetical protein